MIVALLYRYHEQQWDMNIEMPWCETYYEEFKGNPPRPLDFRENSYTMASERVRDIKQNSKD